MPSRLSKLFSSEKGAIVTEREPLPPPAYAPDQDTYDPDHSLPPPDITLGFSNLSISSSSGTRLPKTVECIAHLKLLQCFHNLQQEVAKADGLFGIHDRAITALQLPDEEAAKLLSKLGEKRWAVFVARAVDRFEAWSQARFPSTGRPSILDIHNLGPKGQLTERKTISKNSQPQDYPSLTSDDLPPVDVLLVWHAFMLNPRAYFEHCLHTGMMNLWHQDMPWEAVSNAINSSTFFYQANDTAVASFLSLTDRPWSNTDDASQKKISCPSCERVKLVGWTMFDEKKIGDFKYGSLANTVDTALSCGRGYCDQDFHTFCDGCYKDITAEYLCLGKFCHDLKLLHDQSVPMPGTFFSIKGIPGLAGGEHDSDAIGVLLNVNAFFTHGLGEKFLCQSFRGVSSNSMTDVRTEMEIMLRDRTYMYASRAGQRLHGPRSERIAIRRIMSRYWTNASSFPLDLVGAVIRQGGFIEKMHNIDWLHSPALSSTMDRLIVKYDRFLHIMATSDKMAVPTLDVDLAWHTHQLRPRTYMLYTIKRTGQFIDHDDKVPEMTLNDAFAWTSKQYQRMYGEAYSECTCWYCEAIRESHTSGASRLFNTKNAKAGDKLHSVEQDPSKNIHISSHNAVHPDDHASNLIAASRARDLEKAYAAACARAEKKGRKPPQRDDYYWSSTYGYPVYIPAYSPFMAPIVYTPCIYPVNPGCMAMTAGAAGNCCSGTCGGTVAAGGCASGFGGSCGGGAGAVGGCGGSAGAGGCGGGGGGGGCGGGGGGGGGGCGGGGGGC